MSITKGTTISVGLVIVLISGVFWLNTIYFQGQANASDIVEMKQDKYLEQKFREKVINDLGEIKQWIKDTGK